MRKAKLSFDLFAQQHGNDGLFARFPTIAKPQRFSDASVYATTCSLACFIFRYSEFLNIRSVGDDLALRLRFIEKSSEY